MDKNILIVRLDRIGDVVLSTPVIKALRDAYPASRIVFMARPQTADIVRGNPYLDEVIVYDKDMGLADNLRFIGRLRRERFDLAIVLHPTARTHILMFLAGIPRRIGYDKKSGFLLTDRIPHTKQFGLKHETDYALDLLRYIGIEPKEKALYMPVDGKSEEKVRRIFAGNGLEGEGAVVVVHPGASCPSKRWPAANFARVADALTDRFKAKVIVIAGETEKDFGDETARLARNRCVNLSGETSLSDLASVFRRSRLLISNDSGPVHIACAVGTPVIAIFGRSDRGLSPARWAPAGAKDVFLHKDAGCDVCLAHNCKIGFRCLEAVSVEEVLAAAAKLLGG